MRLTKSLFTTYLESPLHLWAQVNAKVSPKPKSVYDLHIIHQGYEVEVVAKTFFFFFFSLDYPGGSTISFEETVDDGNYEARLDGLVHDVVHDTYDIYEIKSTTKVESDHKFDATFQYLIAKASLSINKVFIVHVNGDYVKDGQIDFNQFFTIQDMSEYIAEKETKVYELRQEAWNILKLTVMPTEDHCFNPNKCPYPSLCFPNLSEYSIYDLRRGTKKQYERLIDSDIALLEDIPDTFSLNKFQRLQVRSARSQTSLIDTEAIQKELAQLEYPLYFLDYESYNPAIPLFDTYKPYQHITNQFSIHVVEKPEDEDIKHYEFIATEKQDPSASLAKALCDVIGESGSVIVWHKPFETGRNEELAVLCPEYADQIRSIIMRTYDLMDIFAHGHYVDHRLHGSTSIKQVQPLLVPELSYKELEIGEGATAMLKWHDMVFGDLPVEERSSIKQNLLAYCKLDTWAMVEIWKKLNLLS